MRAESETGPINTARSNAQALLIYEELRRIAKKAIAAEQNGCTLSATELVHTVLFGRSSPLDIPGKTPTELIGLAWRRMRQVLTDRARRRKTRLQYASSLRPTRQGSAPGSTALDRCPPGVLLAVNLEFQSLQKKDPEVARVLYSRLIEGRTWPEIAASLGTTVDKAASDYDFGLAWLRIRLT